MFNLYMYIYINVCVCVRISDVVATGVGLNNYDNLSSDYVNDRRT